MTLTDLAARAEAAGPEMQRELLVEAWLALNPEHPSEGVSRARAEWYVRQARFIKMLDAEAYESAALMLMPEGWNFILASTFDNGAICDVRKEPLGADGTWPGHARASCASLALLAAICRAHGERDG